VYLGAVRSPRLLGLLAAGLGLLACASSSAASAGAGGDGPVTAGAAAPRPGVAPGAPASPQAEARAALARFASAVREGRWADAWALLSAPWMARLTPERLAADWRESGPVGPRALARLEAALAAGLPVAVEPGGQSASLPVGEGKAAALVLEDGRWRVAALE
jgi:hypothetical protein